ncbi:hypothetical protein LXT21_17100 [Myxococcus sp. K38C18041901]|uniref:hypothetical protein n=1 Tax=Myxococcus guangdongensis TaxID=2906760 RepID=UPI0020A7A384|nr:hypothetical protein [Myxococcus guangdongensis]MCP3060501.1 hypothetical protein [Myxococcus guangdongensis]
MATNPSAFDKDFGYLLPFLDKVAAAAAGLEDSQAREELTRLMAEEKVRWERARELLRGAGGKGGGRSDAGASPESSLARASADDVHRTAPGPSGLTVGSLKSDGAAPKSRRR